jgi:heme exporter protein D
VLGTATIVLALITPTLFVNDGVGSWKPWAAVAVTVAAAIGFILRERSAHFPLLDLKLIARPLVSSGLAFKAATGLAVAGMGYMVTLQLQLDWGWPPYLASIGMLPQVVVLIFGGPLSNRYIERVGLDRAAWASAISVVVGLAVFGLLSSYGYVWIAIALVLVAAGIRVNGVVAGTNVLRGLPANRTSIGSALVDTASEVATAVGIAVAGTILAALFTGSIAKTNWTSSQTAQFQLGVMIAGIALTVGAAVLVAYGISRGRRSITAVPRVVAAGA